MDGLLQDLESGQFSPNEMNKEIRKRTGLLNKINAVRKLEDNGIKYLGKSGQPDLYEKKEIFAFYAANILDLGQERMIFERLKNSFNLLRKKG